MTIRAVPQDDLFPLCRRPKLQRLIIGGLIPVNRAFLQIEIERGVLVGGELAPHPRFGAVPDGLDHYPIFSGGQLLNLETRVRFPVPLPTSAPCPSQRLTYEYDARCSA